MAHLGFQATYRGVMQAKASSVSEKKVSIEEAQALQVKLAGRAATPVHDDRSLSFDSSMSSADVRARFMALVARSRETAFV